MIDLCFFEYDREEIPDKSWNWIKQKLVLATLLSPLLIGIGQGTFNAFIPLHVKGLGVTEVGIGLTVAFFSAGSALSRAPSGILSDRVGRKPLIIAGLTASTLAMALISRIPIWALICIVAFFLGTCVGTTQTSNLAFITDLSTQSGKGMALGMILCLLNTGQAIGSTGMGFVANATNLETMFLACAGTMATGLIVIFILMQTR